MSMTLNQEPHVGNVGVYNMNISFFGNTFINSPNATGIHLTDCQVVRILTRLAGHRLLGYAHKMSVSEEPYSAGRLQ